MKRLTGWIREGRRAATARRVGWGRASPPGREAAPTGVSTVAGAVARAWARGPRLPLAVVPALLVWVSCKPPVADLMNMGPANMPFTRMPYVQAVDTSSASVLWRADAEALDGFRYRVEGDTAWRDAPIRRERAREREVVAPSPLPRSVADRRVRLAGLPPDTRVEYSVRADSVEVGPVAFRTAPRGGSDRTLRVLAFGDSGWGSESQVRLAQLMAGEEWDLAVHAGDVAYELGTELDYTLRHFHVYQRLLATVPFFPSVGDHDLQTDGGAPYDRAFEWPAPAPGARYYTFRWGDVQFVALDTPEDTEPGRRLSARRGEQYRWLTATLDSLDRDPALRWTVVYMHKPLYSHAVGLSGHGSDHRLRNALRPLFEAHGVDLVLSGHDHHYERTHPLLDDEVVGPGCGPVYMVIGGGGASRYARSIAPAPVAARQSRAHHFLGLTIDEEAIRGRAVGVNGETVDEFEVRPFGGGPPGPACR